jgi:endoglycosylceramidase
MPKRGEIDYDYLGRIREIVRMAAKYDIYVLLDAH